MSTTRPQPESSPVLAAASRTPLKVWETSLLPPAMHIFDVCFPAIEGINDHGARFDHYKDTAFPDHLEADLDKFRRTHLCTG